MNIDISQNSGFIPVQPVPEDYVFGADTPVKYQVRLETGDWTPYAPTGENQKFRHFDSMACVTFSAIDCIETQIKYFTGETINFSDRFIAKLSGTTPQGNNMKTVIDTIRKYGLVLEEEWPSSEDFNWGTYYADIPQSVMDKAKKYGDIYYKWILDTSESEALKQAPIQIGAAICPGWNYPPVQNCNLTANHCTELLKMAPKTILDHYVPYIKTLADNYYLAYKLLIIYEPNMTSSKLVKKGNALGFWSPATTPEALVSIALERGYPLPTLPMEPNKPDFSKIKPDFEII